MAQEFTINSSAIETKINQLLPSQGGFQPGVDFSASTMVIPIVDLTETAEGSSVREDLQSALSHTSCTSFEINNATDTTIINTTGYFRVFGTVNCQSGGFANFELTDGTTQKRILSYNAFTVTAVEDSYDYIIFLAAGDSLLGTGSAQGQLLGVTRQLADIDGNLVNPL